MFVVGLFRTYALPTLVWIVPVVSEVFYVYVWMLGWANFV